MSDSEHITDKRVKTVAGAVLLLWLVLVLILAADDAFSRGQGELPPRSWQACLRRFLFSLLHFGQWARFVSF